MTDLALSNSLTDLAFRIRKYHEATVASLKSTIESAMNAGDLLIEAKAKLKHGQWQVWLKDHCAIPSRTARHYMRLANARASLTDENGNMPFSTINEAIEALAPPPSEGEAILKRIEAANDLLAEAVADKMERQRVFANWYFEQSPADQKAILKAISDGEEKIARWRDADDSVREEVWAKIWFRTR
jgi:Protein of unknown function (DUF3102)